MLKIGDLTGHHQPHWFMCYTGGEFRVTLWRRIVWGLRDFLFPREPRDAYMRILPGQPIEKIGTGYNDPLMPGEKTRSVRRGGSCAYRYQD